MTINPVPVLVSSKRNPTSPAFSIGQTKKNFLISPKTQQTKISFNNKQVTSPKSGIVVKPVVKGIMKKTTGLIKNVVN